MVQPSWRIAAPRTHTVRCACPRRPRRDGGAGGSKQGSSCDGHRSRGRPRNKVLSASKLFSWTRRTTCLPVEPRDEAALDLGGRRKSVLAWPTAVGRRGHAHRTWCVRGLIVKYTPAGFKYTVYTAIHCPEVNTFQGVFSVFSVYTLNTLNTLAQTKYTKYAFNK